MVWEKSWKQEKRTGGSVGLAPGIPCALKPLSQLYGYEISQDISPLEAGLGYFVKFDKGDFIGREALLKQKQEGPRKKACRL